MEAPCVRDATPIGTVKTRIRRGRSLLRSAIESLGAAGPVVLATLSSFDEGAPASSEEPASS
jgi:hypothetical protein